MSPATHRGLWSSDHKSSRSSSTVLCLLAISSMVIYFWHLWFKPFQGKMKQQEVWRLYWHYRDYWCKKNQQKNSSSCSLQAVGRNRTGSIHTIRNQAYPFEDSFFSYTSILFFLAGLFFGYFIPGHSWKGGFWLTLPWIVRTFFVIASTGFKDGIPASIGWLLLYSLPILPASAGTYAGGLMAKLISSIRKG